MLRKCLLLIALAIAAGSPSLISNTGPLSSGVVDCSSSTGSWCAEGTKLLVIVLDEADMDVFESAVCSNRGWHRQVSCSPTMREQFGCEVGEQVSNPVSCERFLEGFVARTVRSEIKAYREREATRRALDSVSLDDIEIR